MPYIPRADRLALDIDVNRDIETPGELNYMFTIGLLEVSPDKLKDYLKLSITTYLLGQKPNYALYNGVVGALICARLEHERRTQAGSAAIDNIVADTLTDFYIRVMMPYEDKRIAENGDLPQYAALAHVVAQQQPLDKNA